MTVGELFGFRKAYKSKPKANHPWKRAAFVAVEEKKAGKRAEREWRDGVVAYRDRMRVKA